MQLNRSMILIFSISFILLIGLTTISATDNTNATTNTQNSNIQTDNIATHNTNTITKNTTQTITNDNTKTDTIKKSSIDKINTNDLETVTKTEAQVSTNTKQKDAIDQNNNQNTNIQTNGTINNKENNYDQETTLKTNTLKTTNFKQANDDTNTIYINASYSGSSDGTKEKPYTDINTGFNNIGTITNVYIADGTYNVTSTITIDNNLNITGESTTGTIISGQKDTKYVQIITINNKGCKVNITNITFTNGNATSGGAIYNNGTLTITNSSLINNTATGTDNHAYAGAIYNNGTITITNSSFINNTATGTDNFAYGGAIYNNQSATFTVTSSNFINNTATSKSTKTGVITTEILIKAYGGAIYNYKCTLTITSSSFINNTATSKAIQGSLNDGFGGAIYNDEGTLTITDTNLVNNKATTTLEKDSIGSNLGGAIYTTGPFTAINSNFINNTAIITAESGTKSKVYGGAIYNKDEMTIKNSSFINNTAIIAIATNSNASGGAIYDSATSSSITNSSFINNTVTVTGTNNLVNGGAIYNYYTKLTANYNIFLNNTDSKYEIYNEGNNINSLDYNWWGQNTTNYQNSPYTLGLTNYNGDKLTKWIYLNITSTTDTWTYKIPTTLTTNLTGYYENTTSTTSTLTTEELEKLPQNIPVTYTTHQGTITDNTLLKNGISTATYTPKTIGTIIITSTIYTNNTTLTKKITLDTIYVNASTTTIGTGESWTSPVKTIQDALDRVSDGGKIILAEGTYDTTGDYALTIEQNVNITGQTQNKVIIDGLKTNQIMKINNGYTINITNITFANGKAEKGGAIYNDGTLNITNASFINNTAKTAGTIYNQGKLNVTDSILINNTATDSNIGGLITNYGTLTVNYNIILNSTDNTGIEIYNYGTIKSLDYNWWGQNTTNYQNSPYTLGLTNYNGDKLTKWIYLNITSTTDTWIYKIPTTLTTNLTGYYENTTSTTSTLTTEELEKLPQNIPVTYTTYQGTITDNTLLKNGISTATYTPKTTGTNTITSNIYTNSTTLTKEVKKLDTIYVNSTATITQTGESWNSPVITIQDALDRVSDGGKIILAEGKYNVTGDYGLTIEQNVNITGQRQDKIIIDGLKTNQIMKINNGYTVNITNITFTNGQAQYGGAINNTGTLTIYNSNFINNTATTKSIDGYAFGGAIYNTGTLTIYNSNFINNTVIGTGLYSNTFGGAIYNTGNNLTVSDSSFINNIATIISDGYAYGGAIYNTGNNLTVTGSSFINNTATKIVETRSNTFGGAIYNTGNNLTAEYNIFLNNKDFNNYEIYNNGGTVTSLDYNWWGQNTTNYQNSPYTLGLTNYNGNKLTKWIYLNMTTSTDTWNIGSPVTLTTNLKEYYENTTSTTSTLTTEELEKLPQNIPVTYTTNQGTITDNTLLINGIATATYTPVISGENTITANIYTNNTSITKTINKIDTSITMNNINGTTKENLTITAIITSNGNTINTGTVTFTDTNGLTKTVDVNNGIATTNISYDKPGNYTVTANYNGDTMYSSSQTTATATIKTRDVNMNITVTSSTTTGNTTFDIVIKDLDGNNVTDGTIYFYNNNTLLGNTTVTNGTANYQYIFSKAGNYNITAVYNSTLYNSVNKTVQFTITKSNTKIVVNPITGTVQNTITLQANITDQYGNNVTSGKVVFKINGTTIKDSKGNPIYAQVTNGIATLQYTIPNSLTKDNLTIQAIYSGTNDTYNPSRNNNTINVTKRTANINLIITKNPVKATDTVTFMTLIHDTNGTIISNGQVVFKFNGKTIRDNNGNTIKVNVTNGQAKLEYTIPNGISAKTYNITAVYANNDYNRAETNTPLTTEKINTIITINPTTTTRGSNTTLLTGIIKDTNGNLMVGTHKIEVKLNGKSIGTYTTTNGIINTNITIPNTLKNTNYTITVKIGDTNGYYRTNTTTTLTINNLKTFKQKVSI